MALLYTVATSDRVYFELRHNELSYRLSVVPSVVMSILADHLIRISSMRYGNDLVKLLELTDNCNSQHQGYDRMGYLYSVPTIFFACALVRLIGRGFVDPRVQARLSMTNLKTGSDWDWLIAPGMELCEFFRRGSFSLALCFLIMFGRRVVAKLDLVSTKVLENCASSGFRISPGDVRTVNKAERLESSVGHDRDSGENLVEIFVQLQMAFEIYSNIAGAFIFAIVIETGIWVFKMASRVFFIHQLTNLVFASALTICQCLIAILVLFMVAEVGHQIVRQVQHSSQLLFQQVLVNDLKSVSFL